MCCKIDILHIPVIASRFAHWCGNPYSRQEFSQNGGDLCCVFCNRPLCCLLPFLPEGFLGNDFLGVVWILGPAALCPVGTPTAVFTLVPGGGHKLSIPHFRCLPHSDNHQLRRWMCSLRKLQRAGRMACPSCNAFRGKTTLIGPAWPGAPRPSPRTRAFPHGAGSAGTPLIGHARRK